MKLDVYNTHMELYPYTKDDYPYIEDMYTITKKYAQDPIPCGYFIQDGKLFLPRGTPIGKVENICGVKANYVKIDDEWEEMDTKHYALIDPRDELQENSIEFLTTDTNPQLGLNLATGKGKTYVVCNAATALREKMIIITPNDGLKLQWLHNLSSKFNYRPKNIINIAGSAIIDGIMDDMIPPADIYAVNHQTLHNYMSSHNPYALHNFFRKIKVGIKVYDEAHLQFGNILLIDSFTNTKRTWYLTATFDRSDKDESRCFKIAFSSVSTFGEAESRTEEDKHVIYHTVNINSRISTPERRKFLGYIGLNSTTYGKYAFENDKNKSAYKAILACVKKVVNLEGKILILVPLIAAVDQVAKDLSKENLEKSIGVYHSQIPVSEKEANLEKDIIVSTNKSCGTGKDITGLRTVICCDAIASKILTEQMIGRLRPYPGGLDTYFFDIVDRAVPNMQYFWQARYKKILALVKDIVNLEI